MAGVMVLFILIIVVSMFAYAQYAKNRKPKYRPGPATKSKAKQAQFPPLELTIADTWVKCEVQMERGTVTPISQLLFSFYDIQDNNVHSKSYGSKEAQSYQRQLSKLLQAHGFEMSESSDYREWAKYIYIRTPESS